MIKKSELLRRQAVRLHPMAVKVIEEIKAGKDVEKNLKRVDRLETMVINLQVKHFFASLSEHIAEARAAEKRKMN